MSTAPATRRPLAETPGSTTTPEVVDWGRSGPNQMITLNALRTLKAVGRLTPTRHPNLNPARNHPLPPAHKAGERCLLRH